MDILIPSVQLTTNPPMSEAVVGAAGGGGTAARDDHQHTRITSSTRVTLDGSGVASVTYTRTYPTKPGVSLIAINPAGQPIVLEVVSDTFVGGVYTGCVIKGSRSRVLPVIEPVSGLLTAVITGVNSLVTALTGYNIFVPAANVEVSVIAVMASN